MCLLLLLLLHACRPAQAGRLVVLGIFYLGILLVSARPRHGTTHDDKYVCMMDEERIF